ncbi:putative 2-dehydropantoate 2-reductase [Penicillium rolfsii]|nr:putative 2-dehydropantoate 2-reductase [Penicillium rolfsii]
MAPPRVLIFGTGSLGIVLGAFLHKSGAEVVCVCRSNYHAAKTYGLIVDSIAFENYAYHPTLVQSVSEAAALADRPFDYILLCTKAFSDEVPSPVELISQAVSSAHTCVVIVQNGIGVEEAYKKRYPANLIISAVAYMPSTRVSETHVIQTETQQILLGAYPSSALSEEEEDRIRGLTDMLRSTGARAEMHADIQVERWKKLVGNTTWNPICALSRCRDLEFLGASNIAGSFVEAAMNEVVAVARAVGYGDEVNEEAVRIQVQRSIDRAPPGVQPSMMADMLRGGKMEVEAIVGNVVRIAREKKVSVPRLEALYVLASALNWRLAQEMGNH